MRTYSHQAIRLFLISFATGLIVFMVGGLIMLTLPKRSVNPTQNNSSVELSSNDLSQTNIHVHGVVTTLGDRAFTMNTQGIANTELPASVTVHYSDGTLQSVDTAAAPDPASGKSVEAHVIDATELRVGDTVDVTVIQVQKDSTDIDATHVLQIL